MNRPLELCGAVALCIMAAACAQMPQPGDEAGTAPASGPEPEVDAKTVSAADGERAGEEGGTGDPLPETVVQEGSRRESLTCFAGSRDRHARIGVELVNERVTYFAYYSKWRPRTCSIEAGNGDPYSRWTHNGDYYTVTLADRKSRLRIEQKGGAYRFAFLDVDRARYCGMDGKINGSLTVIRGKKSCVVEGIMDGHGN